MRRLSKPSPKDAAGQILREFGMPMTEDGRRTNDRREVITIAHLSLWLR